MLNYETGLYYENKNNVKASITCFISNSCNAIESETIDESTNSYLNVGKAINQDIQVAAFLPVFIPELMMNLRHTYTLCQQIW